MSALLRRSPCPAFHILAQQLPPTSLGGGSILYTSSFCTAIYKWSCRARASSLPESSTSLAELCSEPSMRWQHHVHLRQFAARGMGRYHARHYYHVIIVPAPFLLASLYLQAIWDRWLVYGRRHCWSTFRCRFQRSTSDFVSFV